MTDQDGSVLTQATPDPADPAAPTQGAIGDQEIIADQGTILAETYKVDIVFALDSTASMRPSIDGVKENIKKLVADVRNGMETGKGAGSLEQLRVRVIEYRDLVEDKRRNMVDHPFEVIFDGATNTESTDRLYEILGKIEAIGGGKLPESTFDAMCEAYSSPWAEGEGKKRKLVVVITDAESRPLHERSRRPGEEQLDDIDILRARMSDAMGTNELRTLLVAPKLPCYEKVLDEKYIKPIWVEPNFGGVPQDQFDQVLDWIVASL